MKLTEKREQYIKNAGVVGSIPNEESEKWGKATGLANSLTEKSSQEQIKAYLESVAKSRGITVEELVAQMIND